MHRRTFVRLLSAVASAHAVAPFDAPASASPASLAPQLRPGLPGLRVVSAYTRTAGSGMPGPYPGRVISVQSDRSVDVTTGQADDAVVREMMAQGMRVLTRASTTADTWRRFFGPDFGTG